LRGSLLHQSRRRGRRQAARGATQRGRGAEQWSPGKRGEQWGTFHRERSGKSGKSWKNMEDFSAKFGEHQCLKGISEDVITTTNWI